MEHAQSRRTLGRLPLELSSFVGRETEIAQVAPLVLTHRLVTLTASGGAGKTRLAYEVAARLAPEFADGVCVAELASLADPSLVAESIAQVLGLLEPAGTPVLERLSIYLNERNLLLLLDNCEHLIEACAELARSLLPNCCSDLRILATSREPLGVPGEIAWRVPPLPVPPAEVLGDVPAAECYDGVRLFVQRAREAARDFGLTPQNSPAVSAICRGLDGMPLAIELAAARVKVLTPQQIEARLGDAFGLLSCGGRGAPPRHRTMRATIDWSYRLLDERAAAVLRRLAVFRGGFRSDAIAAVCADVAQAPSEAFEITSQLVDKSLVVARVQGQEMRFYLLEVIRQFSAEELRGQSEEDAARLRHLDYYLALAEQAKPQLRSPKMLDWLERLDLEHDNLRAALDYALERADESEWCCAAVFRMTAGLEPFWRIRGHLREGRAWLARALTTRAARERPTVRGRALIDDANLAWFGGGDPRAQPLIEESIGVWREVKPERTWELAEALRILGMIRWSVGDLARARTVLEESLALFRSIDDERGAADVLWNIGATLLVHDPSLARELLEQAVAIYDRLGDPSVRPHYQLANLAVLAGDYVAARTIYGRFLTQARAERNKYFIAWGQLALGRLARLEGNLEEARLLHAESIRVQQEVGEVEFEELEGLALVLVAQGDYQEAVRLFGRCIESFRVTGDEGEVAGCLIGLAAVKIALGRLEEAAQLLGAAETLYVKASGTPYGHHLPDWNRCVKSVRAALHASMLAQAWAAGRSLSLDAAVDLGMHVRGAEPIMSASSLTPLQSTKAQFGGLTAREREIAACVASGKSNREIADALVVSERTVEAHVGNIFSKLEFTSRTQIATWALEKGLVRAGSAKI